MVLWDLQPYLNTRPNAPNYHSKCVQNRAVTKIHQHFLQVGPLSPGPGTPLTLIYSYSKECYFIFFIYIFNMRFSRLIWLGTILSFRRNNQRTLLPYHRCSDITQRLKVVPSSVAYDIAGDYFQALRHITAPAAPMVGQQSSLIITPE